MRNLRRVVQHLQRNRASRRPQTPKVNKLQQTHRGDQQLQISRTRQETAPTLSSDIRPVSSFVSKSPTGTSYAAFSRKKLPARGRARAAVDLRRKVKELGLQMSEREITEAVASMPLDMHGRVTPSLYQTWLRQQTQPTIERLALLQSIAENNEKTGTQKFLTVIDYAATSLYAALGTIVAGEAGMHVVGATLVGCLTGLGGGTLNNVATGKSPVFWMASPRWLVVCIASCVATFYGWPMLEEELTRRDLEEMMAGAAGGKVHVEGFAAWLDGGGEYAQRLRMTIARDNPGGTINWRASSAKEIFDTLDTEQQGYLPVDELREYLRGATMDSPALYVADTFCLTSFSIAGAQTGIVRGLHPVVCATLGVTICFGGIARDLLCRRDVALGAENFAAATGFGAAVYVSLRQLMLRGLPLPLWARTVISGTAVVGLRYWAWLQRPEPLLGRMQYRDFTIDSRAARASSGVSRRITAHGPVVQPTDGLDAMEEAYPSDGERDVGETQALTEWNKRAVTKVQTTAR